MRVPTESNAPELSDLDTLARTIWGEARGEGREGMIAVAWVALTLCQLAVTVAGNLAVLPLTGVTFPFVSFGMTSLVVNMAFLALCLNVDLH